MNSEHGGELATVLEAMSFAAKAHRQQFRKDQVTPYVAHPFRVCFLIATVFGITDPVTLTAAVLHDTIEDTTTDHDDLSAQFGDHVADIVAVLSKDKRLANTARDESYFQGILAANDRVKIIKLGDTLDNLIDSRHLTRDQQAKTIIKAKTLLDRLEPSASDSIQFCISIVRNHLPAILAAG